MEKNKEVLIFGLFLLVLLVFFVVYLSGLRISGFAVVEQKSELNQGETFFSVISGNFIERITKENIFFYHDHERIPMIYEVSKINEDYYVYALLMDKQPGNYSLVIKNVRYREGFGVNEEDIVKNFTIKEGFSDFYVSPGFVIASDDFSLELKNLQDKNIIVAVNSPPTFISSENSLEIKSGETKKISFEISDGYVGSSSPQRIEISSEKTFYSVPVFIEGLNAVEKEGKFEFRFEPNNLEVSMPTDSDTKRIVYLLNNRGDLENVALTISNSLEPYLDISPSRIDLFKNGSAEKIEISFVSKEDEKNVSGWVTASNRNFSSSMAISLNFIKGFIPETEKENIVPFCSQLEGVVCSSEEKCLGESHPAKDGLCCRGECQKVEKSSTGKYVGWGIVIILIVILILFWRKYKKAR